VSFDTRALPNHRPNVGVVLFNRAGQVWLGRRLGQDGPFNWQFPQGGVDDGEDLFDAALRELEEETGVRSVEVLDRAGDWIAYDFTPEIIASGRNRGWQGQKQAWFALRFTGEESEIRLDAHPKPEFDAWRWADLGEAPGLVAPFKREAYEQVVRAFAAVGPE
jgi:putative (di)nucleoside polyphosphate hydrolase